MCICFLTYFNLKLKMSFLICYSKVHTFNKSAIYDKNSCSSEFKVFFTIINNTEKRRRKMKNIYKTENNLNVIIQFNKLFNFPDFSTMSKITHTKTYVVAFEFLYIFFFSFDFLCKYFLCRIMCNVWRTFTRYIRIIF